MELRGRGAGLDLDPGADAQRALPTGTAGQLASRSRACSRAAEPQLAYPVRDDEGRLIGVAAAANLEAAPEWVEVARLASRTIVDADAQLDDVVDAGASGPIAVVSGQELIGAIPTQVLDGYLNKRMHELGR